MKWVTTQHLDLQPVRSGSAAIQPHCAAFHHSQALFAVAVGRNVVGEFLFFPSMSCQSVTMVNLHFDLGLSWNLSSYL